jgi:hypothetical protein
MGADGRRSSERGQKAPPPLCSIPRLEYPPHRTTLLDREQTEPARWCHTWKTWELERRTKVVCAKGDERERKRTAKIEHQRVVDDQHHPLTVQWQCQRTSGQPAHKRNSKISELRQHLHRPSTERRRTRMPLTTSHRRAHSARSQL